MSYIVKSRDFPKSCNECDEPHLCCDFYYCGVGHQKDGRHLDVDEHYLNKTKHPDCPLSELPKKHGRLIDADRLLALVEKEVNNTCIGCEPEPDDCCAYDRFKKIISEIKTAQTIIEAEVK